ncbi:MAG: cell wall hydrolase [Peptococcaceae bacterium]|nr:cell wall hydrolase [Peptococcaceae bacterium]
MINRSPALIRVIKKISNLAATLKTKKYFPVCLALALVFAAGLAWTGQAPDPAEGEPEKAVHAGQADPAREDPAESYHRPASYSPVSRGGINRGDIYLMARVIEGEAADEPFAGKVAVGAVIVNRMESEKFPDSVRQVVYQPLAFEAVSNGQYMRPLTAESLKAAEMALEGRDPTGGALYYWNPETARSRWVWQRPVITKIGRHVFAR